MLWTPGDLAMRSRRRVWRLSNQREEHPMQVQEIMCRRTELVGPNTTIRDAARKMRADNLGALPVGENDRLVGMVTDRDIVMRGVAEERLAGNTTVREVMSEHVHWCFDDADITDAAKIMAKHQVRRLPVINRDKRLVGVIALADLGRADEEAAKIALEGISEATDDPRR
ncbi:MULTISPECIES: CBS domain-containing protein [unclassified Mesorhizobium]|nr:MULTISPECIES: CBS domain-containing protein [unclassified Mesorhizobium]